MKKLFNSVFMFTLFVIFPVTIMFTSCGGGGEDKNTDASYKVTYDGNNNDGGIAPIDSNTYPTTFTVTVQVNVSLTRAGYTFTCWNTQADGNGTDRAPSSTFSMGSENVTLYAKWTALPTYTVTYNANTGTGTLPTDSNNYLAGATVTVLGNISLLKDGYTFTCWNTQADGNGIDRSPASTFAIGSSNMTLYAKWTALPTYTVTYDANTGTGGIPSDSNNYLAGATVTVLGNISLLKDGYIFNCWNTQADGNGIDRAPASTFAIGSSHITLYAKWTALPTYTVTYDANTGTGGIPTDSNNYLAGATVTVLSKGSLLKDGYTFNCWNTQADGNGIDRAPSSTFAIGSSNMTLYAKWTALPTYTVTYNANTGTGGIPTDSNNYLAGATVTVLSKGSLLKDGYTFNCWNTQADGNGIDRNPASTFAIGSANITLYAKWSIDLNYGLISYWKLNETGGTTASDYISGYSGTLTFTSPAVTTPTFSSGKASNAINFSNGQFVTIPHNPELNITGNLTIAMWIKPSSVTCSGADPAYVLISKCSSNSARPYEFMIGNGGSLRYEAWATNISYTNAVTAAGLVTTGTWQHVAMTRSYSGITATVTFYINGVSVGSSSQNCGPTLSNTNPVWMARDGYFTQYTTQGTYTGSMDEVVIYNRALNPTEMQNLYNLTNSYSVRDVGPSGGLIFYDKGSYSDGWRYLEAAQSDYNIPWSTASSYPISGAIGITVGTGAQNTIDIVNGDPTNNSAADYCSVLVTGAYNDWFLPSKDELNLMYVNLKLYGVGGLSNNFYWSSSQYDTGRAWYQYFQNGTQGMDFSKGTSLCVRPIRAF